MTTRIAILDDWQGAALDAADWDGLGQDAEITVFPDYIEGEAAVAGALKGFDVVVGMRERTPFPKSLIDALPDLKLLITTGMRNLSFDMDAASAKGIVVSGTAMSGYPASEHAVALILALFKKISVEDRAMHEGGWHRSPRVAVTAPPEIYSASKPASLASIPASPLCVPGTPRISGFSISSRSRSPAGLVAPPLPSSQVIGFLRLS